MAIKSKNVYVGTEHRSVHFPAVSSYFDRIYRIDKKMQKQIGRNFAKGVTLGLGIGGWPTVSAQPDSYQPIFHITGQTSNSNIGALYQF